ncbi:MAG: hypothetical protein HQK83_09605 [Fibrobacteria bacterium]|nr:hypothetical protein [Fibrobacteria bacterium]
MSNKFNIEKEQDGDVLKLNLSGVIDEDSDLSDLLFPDHKGKLIINLKEVKRINSCGVREWVNAMETISEMEIELINCSTAIVNQINMVSNFSGNGKVTSFMAPYYCESCDAEFEIALEVDKNFPDRDYPVAPSYNCPKCKNTLEFDDIEDKYFLFIKRE